MGLDLRYACGGDELTSRLSTSDWSTLSSLNEHLPDAIALMTEVPDFGEPRNVERGKLLTAVGDVIQLLTEKPDLLPYTYQTKCCGHPLLGEMVFSTGGISGIRMPGDDEYFYSIDAGLNECTLTKMGIGEDGAGYIVETKDIRDWTEFETTNMGTFRIRKRKAKTQLLKALEEIRDFLERQTADTVEKVIF